MNANLKKYIQFFMVVLCLVVDLQASQKAELKASDFTSENVLHDAVRANEFEMVKYLVKQGVSIDTQDEYGYTPLHLAVRLNQYDIISFLIDHKANINTTDEYEDTPLIDATRNNETDIAKLLICNGAKRNVADINGMTTLQHSAKNKNQEIVNLLRVDNLEPYCQKKIEIAMDPFKVSDNNYYDKNICGDILEGFIVDVSLEFIDEDDEVFGPFPAEFSNETKRWCLDTEKTTLKDDIYEVKAIATDYVVNQDFDARLGYTYAQKLELTFEEKNFSSYPYPRICGATNSDAIDIVNLSVINSDGKKIGEYDALINDKEKLWCADVSDKLAHGYYTLKATGVDLYDQYTTVTKENFFIDTAEFELSIFNLKELNGLPVEICGTSNKQNVQSVTIEFIDENRIIYQLPNAKVDNINKTWCGAIGTMPPKGIYTIKVTGKTKKNEIATDQYDGYDLGNNKKDRLNPKISIDKNNELLGKKPKICGTIEEGNIVKGYIELKDKNGESKGSYPLEIDTKNRRWCAQIIEKLDNGIYEVTANALNSKKIATSAKSTFEVYIIPELYNALYKEFKNDMKEWDASLDPDTLIFSFRNPNALFERGKSKLSTNFKKILQDFFPRYVQVTSQYKKHIQNIIIEGHSSSENKGGKTEQERFERNKILSSNRAKNVLSYTSSMVSSAIGKNILWVMTAFESKGLSSSHLIYNEDGTENKELSRRVEFRIKNVRSEIK